jgi:hypothetical protein
MQFGKLVGELRSTPGSEGQIEHLKGYKTAGDGGEGLFRWSDTPVKDDDGTILNAGGFESISAGWRRVYSGALDPGWFGAVGNGRKDDTVAIQHCCAALQTAGGGSIIFRRPYAVFRRSHATPLGTFSGIRGIKLLCRGGELILPNIEWATLGFWPCFQFDGCHDITVDGFTCSGGSLDHSRNVSSGVVLVDFTNQTAESTNLMMPQNRLSGAWSGARFNQRYTEDGTKRCKRINIGLLEVTGGTYGITASYSGDDLTIGMLRTQDVFRSLFTVGVSNIRAYVDSADRHGSHDVIFAAQEGWSIENCHVHYVSNRDTGSGTNDSIGVIFEFRDLNNAPRPVIQNIGATSPAITFSGTPCNNYSLLLKITTGGVRGVAKFDWSIDGGSTWTATGVTTAATVALGSSGLAANFPTGTYTLNDTYATEAKYIYIRNCSIYAAIKLADAPLNTLGIPVEIAKFKPTDNIGDTGPSHGYRLENIAISGRIDMNGRGGQGVLLNPPGFWDSGEHARNIDLSNLTVLSSNSVVPAIDFRVAEALEGTLELHNTTSTNDICLWGTTGAGSAHCPPSDELVSIRSVKCTNRYVTGPVIGSYALHQGAGIERIGGWLGISLFKDTTQLASLAAATEDYVKFGSTPASTGYIRGSSDFTIKARKMNNGADYQLLAADSDSRVVGNINSDTYIDGSTLNLRSGGNNLIKCTSSAIGFFNATPAAQAARVTQLSDSTGGNTSSNSGACIDVTTLGVVDPTKVNDNMAKILNRLNKLELVVHNLGLTA